MRIFCRRVDIARIFGEIFFAKRALARRKKRPRVRAAFGEFAAVSASMIGEKFSGTGKHGRVFTVIFLPKATGPAILKMQIVVAKGSVLCR